MTDKSTEEAEPEEVEPVRRTASSWKRWAMISGVIGGLWLITTILLYSGSESKQHEAVEAGQHLEIDLTTGEVKGNMATQPGAATEQQAPTGEQPDASPSQDKQPAAGILPGEQSQHNQPIPPAAQNKYGDLFSKAETPAPAEEVAEPEDENAEGKSRFVATRQADEVAESIPVYPRTAASLAAPTATLQESTELGTLPRIGGDGMRPATYYARPFEPEEGSKLISIAISGLGLNKRATEAALTLPREVSLVFDPYAEYSPVWAEGARNLGHEVWLGLPLQPADYPASDPGPEALLSGSELAENLRRLGMLMGRFQGYVGLASPTTESFSSNQVGVSAVVDTIGKRGLLLIFSNLNSSAIQQQQLQTKNKVVLIPDRIIDNELAPAALERELAELENTARTQGAAFGLAHAYPLSIKQIGEWSQGLAEKGLILAPVSALPEIRTQ